MPVLIRSTENRLTHQAPLRTCVRSATWFADHAVVRGLGERKEAEAKPDRESALCVRSAALAFFFLFFVCFFLINVGKGGRHQARPRISTLGA